MGVLNDLQFQENVAEVLAPKPSPQAPSTKKRPMEVSLVLSDSSSVMSDHKAKRQKSILAFGSYTKLTTTKDGEQVLISSVSDVQGVPRASVMHECAQCDFTHHLKCSVALHAKIHSEWAKGSRPQGQGLLKFNSTSVNTTTDSSSPTVGQTVRITVGQTISSKPKGRRGSAVRLSRSWRFKERVLLFLDEKNRRTPNVDDLAVARMFNINKSQLSAWNKPAKRTEIFAQARSIRAHNLTRVSQYS